MSMHFNNFKRYRMKSKIFSPTFFILCLLTNNISCSKSDSNNNVTPPPSPGVSTANISITGSDFSPASLTVKTGTTVKWTNNDATTHTATSDDGSTFNTGDILGGYGYSKNIKVTQTGTFTYHCNYHSMTGTLIVTQ